MEEESIIEEIFAYIGKPKKVQDNKIENDILKVLLLEKITGKKFRKKLLYVMMQRKTKSRVNQSLTESIHQFGIEIMYIELEENMQKQIIEVQERQKITNK